MLRSSQFGWDEGGTKNWEDWNMKKTTQSWKVDTKLARLEVGT